MKQTIFIGGNKPQFQSAFQRQGVIFKLFPVELKNHLAWRMWVIHHDTNLLDYILEVFQVMWRGICGLHCWEIKPYVL